MEVQKNFKLLEHKHAIHTCRIRDGGGMVIWRFRICNFINTLRNFLSSPLSCLPIFLSSAHFVTSSMFECPSRCCILVFLYPRFFQKCTRRFFPSVPTQLRTQGFLIFVYRCIYAQVFFLGAHPAMHTNFQIFPWVTHPAPKPRFPAGCATGKMPLPHQHPPSHSELTSL